MNGEKVLIVEDNPMNMELATALLEVAGYTVFDAEEGKSGIALARAEHPDIILMDIDLPGMSGLEVTRRLKADPETRDIPVVALTAFAMQQDQENAIAAGCSGVLIKPIDTRAFARQVARFLHPEGE